MAKTYWHLANPKLVKRDLLADYTRGHRKLITKLSGITTVLVIFGLVGLGTVLQERTPDAVAVDVPLPPTITVENTSVATTEQSNDSENTISQPSPTVSTTTTRVASSMVASPSTADAVVEPPVSELPPSGGSGGGATTEEPSIPTEPTPAPTCDTGLIEDVIDLLPIGKPEEEC